MYDMWKYPNTLVYLLRRNKGKFSLNYFFKTFNWQKPWNFLSPWLLSALDRHGCFDIRYQINVSGIDKVRDNQMSTNSGKFEILACKIS